MTAVKPLLIGLTGRAGAGKSTVAGMLADQYAFTEIAFADPIMEMVCALFALSDIDGAWAVERCLKEQPTLLGYSYRHLAQTLGTEWGRNLSPDFWLRVATLRIETPALQGENIVFSDVRYPNEAEFIKRRGGIVVRVAREQPAPVRAHSSEAHIDQMIVDAELLNYGSRETLFDQVDRLIGTARN